MNWRHGEAREATTAGLERVSSITVVKTVASGPSESSRGRLEPAKAPLEWRGCVQSQVQP